jgi:hypothetical protein
VIDFNGEYCIHPSYSKSLSSNGSSYFNNTSLVDYPLTNIPPGAAVKTTGTLYTSGVVELRLNNIAIGSIPMSRPLTTNGGELSFRINQGTFSCVAVYVYNCYDASMTAVRCPY